MFNVQSYGMENEKIKTIANHAFDAFTNNVEMKLFGVIEQVSYWFEQVWYDKP